MMKKPSIVILVLVILALTAPSLLAQQRQQRQRQRGGNQTGPGRDLVSLLTQKSVQEELKLSDDQVKKVADLAQSRRRSGRGARNLSQEQQQKRLMEAAQANEKALGEILTVDQLQRAKQINVQVRGAQTFRDPEVITALKLTDDQKQKIKTIQDDARQESSRLFQRGAGNQEDLRKKRDAFNKETQQRLVSLLTPEQKAVWKDLTGEPFKGEITTTGGRGGNRGGRGTRPPNEN
jgi:eukaryotic-like serine/threonine-protein kinase